MNRFLIFTLTILLGFVNANLDAKTLYWNKGRGYEPFSYSTKEGVLIENHSDRLKYDYFKLDNPTKDFTLTFRAKNINGHPSKKYGYITSDGNSAYVSNPHWGFFIICECDTLVFKINGSEKMSANESVAALAIDLYNLSSFKQKNKSLSFTEELNPYDGDNIWKINVTHEKLILNAGNRQLNYILETPCISDITGFGFFAGWGDKLLISDISAEYTSQESEFNSFSPEFIAQYLKESEDPLEGYWTFFDRELEESLLKPGGFYNLVCIKEDDNYHLLYLDGSVINNSQWKIGDLKAILKPTFFSGIFEVEWFDAMKQPMNYDIKAQLGDGNTLNFQFPYQSSKFRMRKMPGEYLKSDSYNQ